MDTPDGTFDLAQFSSQSVAQLEAATEALKSALEEYVATLTLLRGGSADVLTVFDANEVVRRAALAWDNAVFDHTGTFPLAIEDDEDPVDDEDEEDDKDSEPVSVLEISVVSRWDLDVTDAPALVGAGRAAFRRTWPEESVEDACAAIDDDDIGRALYALIHERGETWRDLPGVLVLGGHRAYIDRDGDQPMTTADDDDDFDAPMRVPEGKILHSESWQ